MTIIILQNRPTVPDLRTREWYAPIRSETLSGMADAANNCAAVKSVGHVTHRLHWPRSSDGIRHSDPGQEALTLHRLYLPIRSSFSTHFTWSMLLQGHDFNSGGLNGYVEMCALKGVFVDAPANGNDMVDGADQNNWAIKIDISNGGIPAEGRRRNPDGVPGNHTFPILETRGLIVRSDINALNLPTSARAMSYGSEAGTNEMITILVRSFLCRPLQISINEIAPIQST